MKSCIESLALDVIACVFVELLDDEPVDALMLSCASKRLEQASRPCFERMLRGRFGEKVPGGASAAQVRRRLRALVTREDAWVEYTTEEPSALVARHQWGGSNGVFLRFFQDDAASQLADWERAVQEGYQLVATSPDTLHNLFVSVGPPGGSPKGEQLSALVEALGARFRSGKRMLLDQDLHAVVERLLGAGGVLVSTREATFRSCAEGFDYTWADSRAHEIFSHPELEPSFMERLAWPLICGGATGMRWERAAGEAWRDYFCVPELCLFAIPLHEVDERVVARYILRMQKDAAYTPCVLLYSPWKSYDGDPYSLFGTSAALLDGHHKLHAAVRLKRPIQFVLLQHRHKDFQHVSPFPWLGSTRRQAFEYISSVQESLGNGGMIVWNEKLRACEYIPAEGR